MKKNKKDDILFLKFKLSYKAIFLNIKFANQIKNHFDNRGGFAGFVLAILENQIGQKKLQQHIKINKEDWLNLFFDIYDSKQIKDTYEALKLNPILSLEKITEMFDCFDVAINKIIQYFETEQFDIKMDSLKMKQLLKNGFSFILYNLIDCKIPYDFEDILSDPKYDEKLTMILYNTKLFSSVKQSILNSCDKKISNVITLLLGISQHLNYDKKLIK